MSLIDKEQKCIFTEPGMITMASIAREKSSKCEGCEDKAADETAQTEEAEATIETAGPP
ncbi:MAG: hypothetical protein H0X25_16005 [Acidobacteriales bacterium]|nr:hypothetical protein [Terriglobales bacterium]